MALSRQQKETQVQELTEKLQKAQSVLFAHYIGMTVTEVSELRRNLKEHNAEMQVAKKTLLKLAAKEAGTPAFDPEAFDGPISLIFSFADPLSGGQVAFKFSKDHKQVEILGGMYDGKILDRDTAMELAQMPSRDVLLAMFVSMIRSPLYSFANICNSPLTGFARALNEMAKKGGFADAPEAAPAPEQKEAANGEPETAEQAAAEESPPQEETPATADTPPETEEPKQTPEAA
ncbi:MAG: 50S ribosomal protein L10 [Candidatus Peribacteraceae bacterium]|jgi:large subunit ribosomal protein L10